MNIRNFYVPQWQHWKRGVVSLVFVKLQRSKTEETLRQLEAALSILDADEQKVRQEILGVWAAASVQVMRAFEARLKEIRHERKRLNYVMRLVNEALGEMDVMIGGF